LVLLQSFEAIALNSREVNEYVLAAFNGDEAITFLCVKPFHNTFLQFCHCKQPPKNIVIYDEYQKYITFARINQLAKSKGVNEIHYF